MTDWRQWVPGIRYHRSWVTPAESLTLVNQLWKDLDWKQYDIRIFGRKHRQPRLTAWCSDEGVDYTYSGLLLRSSPWHSELKSIRDRFATELGMKFNSVLVNGYRDGNDAMGWHADDEPELGPQPTIASLSLGAPRRFLVKPRLREQTPARSQGLDLGEGDLLIMDGASQQQWLHSISRTRKQVGLRINLTYRRILA